MNAAPDRSLLVSTREIVLKRLKTEYVWKGA